MCNKLMSKIKSNYSIEPNGCWLWSGTVHTKWGYPQVSVGKFKHLVKRVMFEHHKQLIPPKHNIGTSCNNLLCINPQHLFLKLPAAKAKKKAKQVAYQQSIPTPKERFSKTYTIDKSGCWLWKGCVMNSGYGDTFSINTKKLSAHRASYTLFKGDIPEGMQVCHQCDVKRCVNPDHLFLGTQKDNIADMYKKGREMNPGSKGSENGSAKLTDDDIPAIRQQHAEGASTADLAAIFLVSQSAIQRVINGSKWKHIK